MTAGATVAEAGAGREVAGLLVAVVCTGADELVAVASDDEAILPVREAEIIVDVAADDVAAAVVVPLIAAVTDVEAAVTAVPEPQAASKPVPANPIATAASDLDKRERRLTMLQLDGPAIFPSCSRHDSS